MMNWTECELERQAEVLAGKTVVGRANTRGARRGADRLG